MPSGRSFVPLYLLQNRRSRNRVQLSTHGSGRRAMGGDEGLLQPQGFGPVLVELPRSGTPQEAEKMGRTSHRSSFSSASHAPCVRPPPLSSSKYAAVNPRGHTTAITTPRDRQ